MRSMVEMSKFLETTVANRKNEKEDKFPLTQSKVKN